MRVRRCDAVVVTLTVVLLTAALGFLDKLNGETLAVLLGAALPAANLSRRNDAE